MISNQLLSICIPTYNKSEKISCMIHEICESQPNIQVVVIDNCSDKHNIQILEEISYPNYKLIKREKNIGGIANLVDAYSYSDGKYSLLCLDKDHVNINYLTQFIDFLADNPNIVYGQCSLNKTQVEKNILYPQGYNAVIACGYDCHHPSGFFVCNKTLKSLDIITNILTNYKNFAFNTDIIKVHMMMQGEGCYVNIPLMGTESLNEAAKTHSHTYSNENIWFAPKNVISRMETFMQDAITLGLRGEQLTTIISKIHIRNVMAATFGFKEYLQNELICTHHGIKPRKVGYIEILNNLIKAQKAFLKLKIPISLTIRYKIIFLNILKIGMSILIKK